MEHQNVIYRFSENASLNQDHYAIIDGDKKYTYKELEASTNKLAQHLQFFQKVRKELCFVFVKSEVAAVNALLGVMKAGKIFVPVSHDFPDTAINRLIDDYNPSWIIIDQDSEERLNQITSKRENNSFKVAYYDLRFRPSERLFESLDFISEDLDIENNTIPNIDLRPEDPCYIYFTSGSTGKPKAVFGAFKGLNHFIDWEINFLQLEKPNVSQFSALTFDVFLRDTFVPLCSGGTLCIPPRNNGIVQLDQLLSWIKEKQVNLMHCVPTLFRELISSAEASDTLPHLKYILLAGEKVFSEDVRNWYQTFGDSVQLVNIYGPSETTLAKFAYKIDYAKNQEGEVPLGQTIPGSKAILLDDNLMPVRKGDIGEIYIRTPYRTLGYYKNQELTDKVFIKHPMIKDPEDRLYKTGDLAIVKDDGNFEFKGRVDFQVKVKGIRVELSAIESVLRQHPEVEDIVVLYDEKSKNLAACIKSKVELNEKEIKLHLSQSLPEYMVPLFYLFFDSFPINKNGKTDRKQLFAQLKKKIQEKNINLTLPSNKYEEQLASIWKNILNLEEVGTQQNFFELGGHSLLATRVAAMIRKTFSVEVSIKDLFDHPTIASLSAYIQKQEKGKVLPEITVQDKGEKIPLSFAQERLWFLDKLEGSTHYHIPSVLKLEGKLNKIALKEALVKIVERHQTLRTILQESEGKAWQTVKSAKDWKLTETDMVSAGEEQLKPIIEEIIQKPFSLSDDYMLRTHLISCSKKEHILILVMHHIASDGWSIGMFVNELVALYQAHIQQENAKLPELPIQYSDYSIWQRKYLEGAVLEQKLNFWKKQLNGVATLELQTDFKRPKIQSTKGETLFFSLNEDLTQSIQELGQQEGASLFMTLLTAFKVLIYHYSGQEDICVGTPIANRTQSELEPLIGFFINTLALRSDLSNNPSFQSLLSKVKSNTLEAYTHQDVPFEKIVDSVTKTRDMSRTPLFQVMFVLQNNPSSNLELGELSLSPFTMPNNTSKYDLTFNVNETNNGLHFGIEYCTDLFRKETIQRMFQHFKLLLEAVTKDVQLPIANLNILPQEEEKQLLVDFNNTSKDFSTYNSVIELFEFQAENHPENIALHYQNTQLNFKELNQKANQLANHLIYKGVKDNDLIALCVERSPEMLIGILGILKAGAVYVPIDPEYPQGRTNYIIEDTESSFIVISTNQKQKFDTYSNLQILEIDNLEISKEPVSNPKIPIQQDQQAYVIYTSGTSGKPKGVIINHGAVLNLIQSQQQNYGVKADDVILQFSNYVFDASVEQLFLGLTTGAKLVIPTNEQLLNPDLLESLIIDKGITHLDVTPSFLKTMNPKHYSKLRRVIAGGEFCPPSLAEKWHKNVPFFNVYGPTEATVTSIIYQYGNSTLTANQLPIGKPIHNTQLYVLNSENKPVPIGVAGELCIGGKGLAVGYLNNKELTDKKFIANPFIEGEKIYKTGDLVKWLPDGNLIFLGRIDEQVKIRGFRIELEEIESVLQMAPKVEQGVVKVISDENGNQKLAAYVVGKNPFNKKEIKDFLKEQLPVYMIPNSFIQLENLPISPSGKVNKKALPDPDPSLISNAHYSEPRNTIEQDLATIWKELLNLEQVGIYDNFFELGGDSIITIQVVSRAKKSGHNLKARDLFQYQSIAELAEAIKDRKNTVLAEQDQLNGNVPLLPIQQSFLQQDLKERSYYNQSVLLEIGKDINEEILINSFEFLVGHHDALRMSFNNKKGNWLQSYGAEIKTLAIEDLSKTKPNQLSNNITSLCQEYQENLKIEKGEVFKSVWIKTPESEVQNRLFLVAHHLVIDGVSWRILLEHLENIIAALLKNKNADLGYKTSSYREWGTALINHASKPEITDQLEHWQEVYKNYKPLPTDHKVEKPFMKDVKTHAVTLDKSNTNALLKASHKAYNTEINDLLLSALAKTISHYAQSLKVVIGLEGHGREDLFENIDTSSTIGWFTNLFPLALELDENMLSSDLIPTIKEQIRRVPGKGMGYGMLRYLHPSDSVRNSLSDKEPEIVFNYLGQLDNATQKEGLLQGAKESTGKNSSDSYPFQSKIEINCAVTNGKLRLSWNYSKLEYNEETIQNLADQFLSNLIELISHCVKSDTNVKTPSDYGLAPEISHKELQSFLNEAENGLSRIDQISSLYRLSPMQEGMLFHSLFDNSSEAYIEQMVVDLPEGVSASAFKDSWNFLIKNHSILRSKFIHNTFSIPVQVVYQKADMPFYEIDYSHLNFTNQQKEIEQFLSEDRKKGFDFNEVPLMRISLIKTSEKAYKMVWTSHHVLTDGWSIPILMGELLLSYQEFAGGNQPSPKTEDKYEDFINYINGQSSYKEKEFWTEYMKGFETPSLLPFTDNTQDRNKGKGKAIEEVMIIDQSLTKDLKLLAQNHHVTVNTIVQGIWALLLSRYSRSNDVTFGVTVSGRPSDLKNAEQKIGLYINTLPLRATISDGLIFTNWLSQIQQGHTQSREFQHTAINDIQKFIGIQGDLFDSLLVFENHPMGEVLEKDWLLKVGKIHSKEQSNFLLTLMVSMTDELAVKFIYNDELFDPAHIAMIQGHFKEVVSQISQQPEIQVAGINILTPKEIEKQLTSYNDTVIDYPVGKTLNKIFEEQVVKTPDNIALVYDNQRITYQDLNEKASKLATYLKKQGIPLNAPIPLVSHKSAEQIWAVYGILKAGGHYIPIKGDLPKARINELLEQTEAEFVLVQPEYLSKIESTSNTLIIELEESTFENESNEFEPVKVKETDLAYIIFTSGSTGKPKGVMIDHRGAVNTLFDINSRFKITEKDKVFGVSELNFDLSVYDIFGTLACGATLVLPKEEEIHDPVTWIPYIEQEKVTVWDSVPQLMSLLIDHVAEDEKHKIASLRTCWMSGDWIPLGLPEKIWKLNPNMELISMGGATEGSIWSIHFPIKEVKAEWQSIPYGYPLGNQEMYVLDDNLQPCPVLVPGGIHIGGKGVAKGYHKDPEKTANSFIEHPDTKEILYRTGDLGYYHPEGYLVFVGRLDTQVKVNGYRIELGEIETVLQQCPEVDQCVVIVKESENKVKRLVAYIVPHDSYNKNAIQKHLQDRLPEYMVPSIMMELEELPLTANGKVNKKVLPEPEGNILGSQGYAAPTNETEKQIAHIWQDLLKINQIGIHDNFFELGGHSLLATRAVSAIRKKLKVELAIRILFEKPTIASISNFIQEQSSAELLPAITQQPRPLQIPLSFSQERLWFIDQLEGSTAYHIPAAFKLTGVLNKENLELAFRKIVNKHEILRTRLQSEKGIPYQEIMPENRWQLKFTKEENINTNETALNSLIEKELNNPFDLSQDHMLRSHLLQCSQKEHILLLVMHHIASDGWSVSLFIRELVSTYQSLEEGKEIIDSQLPIQYADYAIWQHQYLEGEILQKKLKYWKEKLTGVVPLELPTDFSRPAVQSTKGNSIGFKVETELSDQIKKLSQKEGTTLFMTLLAAFKVLLFRYSGQEDICVGSPIANRTQNEIEPLIGFFVNTLALRSQVIGKESFASLLKQIKSTTLEAYAQQEVPFEKIVEQVQPERDMSRSPLFQVMFVLQNNPEAPELKLGEVALSPIPFGDEATKFDLTLHVNETNEGLHFGVEYCSDLFKEETIGSMMHQFMNLLKSIVAKPNERIGKLQLATAKDLELIDNQFSNSLNKNPEYKDVISIFEAQVNRSSGNTALIYKDSQLTFKEFNEKANQLAHYFIDKGLQKGELVGICLDNSIEMMVSIYGALKAGAVYVPFDAKHPKDRINYIIEDTQLKWVITDKSHAILFENYTEIELINLDVINSNIQNSSLENPEIILESDNLAYIIYTSGSTGKPKGTLVTHGNLAAYLDHAMTAYICNNENKAGSFVHFSNTFDASITALFAPLIQGKFIVISSNTDYQVFDDINLEKHAPYDFIKLTPAHLQLIETQVRKSSKDLTQRLVLGGEALHKKDFQYLNDLKKNIEIINEYGPTETTVGCTTYSFNVLEDPINSNNGVSIGKPINNVEIFILDQFNNKIPMGIPGELCIAGPQVTNGYLNQEELNHQKFIQHPFSNNTQDKIYKTGDKARWLTDGNIEFLGRYDEQVKIRGYRVETGEIENTISTSGLTNKAIVIARKDAENRQRLFAYVVPNKNYKKEKLINHLASVLPEYILPSAIMEIDHIPLTSNGKINKKALPNPDINSSKKNKYIAPANPIEMQLVDIWKELLQVEKIGIEDNFFELGGHSLLATRVIANIREILKVELEVKDVFLHSTIKELALLISEKENKLALPAIQKQSRPEQLPLSFSQERLWILDKLQGSHHYHMPSVFRLKGKLDKEALEKAFKEIVDRHEILRTIILEEKGNGYQQIKPLSEWQMGFTQIDNQREQIDNLLESLAIKPFDLSQDILLRVQLIELTNNELTPDTENEYLVAIVMHHIVSDGWSIAVMMNELIALYNAFSNNQDHELEDLPIQYADYALWQRNYLEGSILEQKIDYWENNLTGIEPLKLPTDFPRPAIQSTSGGTVTLKIEQDLQKQLKELSQKQGTTLFMTLLTAYKVLLYRYTGQSDICVGTPIANRAQKEIESLIGFFVNTLALRSDLGKKENNESLSFSELLSKVKSDTLEAFSHQEVPFERIVDRIEPARDTSHSPIFQVMFVMHNNPENENSELEGLTFTAEPFDYNISKFDLNLFINEVTDGIKVELEYCTDLFEHATAERMIQHFLQLLKSIVITPEKAIDQLPMTTNEENQLLLKDYNNTEVNYSKGKTLTQLFEEQTSKTPENTALAYLGKHYTYKEINAKANRLANYLEKSGQTLNAPIPLVSHKGPEQIWGVLGIHKAGGHYIPIKGDFPKSRINELLNQTEAKLVLVQEEYLEKIEVADDVKVIVLKDATFGHESTEHKHAEVLETDLAYIIFTSGSTGKPKGVMIDHRGAVNTILDMNARFGVTEKDKVFGVSELNFDLSVYDIFGTFACGATLVLPTESEIHDPIAWLKYVEEEKVTIWDSVPQLMGLLIDHTEDIESEKISSLRMCWMSGDWIPLHLPDKIWALNSDMKLFSLGGATEGSIWSIHFPIEKINNEWQSIPYGYPLGNQQMYILNEALQPCPYKVPGGIYIGGKGVAKGYHKDEVKTANSFIYHPEKKEILYKTGDMGYHHPDGHIVFAGRVDTQVKVNGYRIELGEIETTLNQSSMVSQSIVVVKEAANKTKKLVAYVVTKPDYDKESLQFHLQSKLPEYMVPSVIMELDEMPLTANGKVNKKQLPEPESTTLDYNEIVNPTNETEEKLSEIWQELLEKEQLGINDNFFEAGGNSILAVKLMAIINKQFGVKIPIASLFNHPTISELGGQLLSTHQIASERILINLNKGKNKQTIFCAPPAGGNVMIYQELARLLGEELSFYAFQSHGLDGKSAPLKSIEAMASAYIKEMQAIDPQGPYQIGGYSIGGRIAFEMASQLEKRGFEVSQLIIFDAIAPEKNETKKDNDQSISHEEWIYGLTREMESSDNQPLLKLEELTKKTKEEQLKVLHEKLINRGDEITFDQLKGLTAVYINNASLSYSAQGKPLLKAPITLFKAKETAYEQKENNVFQLSDYGWRAYTNNEVNVIELEGNHRNLLTKGFVENVAEGLKNRLNEEEAGAHL